MPLSLRSIALTLVLLVACPAFGSHQSAFEAGGLRFDHLLVSDGLPDDSIRGILQDSSGFMWFGTQDGLVRYDGYECVSHWRNAETGVPVPRFFVSTMVEDAQGMIWLGTHLFGLWRLDPKTEIITHVPCGAAGTLGDIDTEIRDICLDNEGYVVVARSNTGFCRHGHDGSCLDINRRDPDDPSSLPSDHLTCIFVDDRGGTWVGLENDGLAYRDPAGADWSHFKNDPKDASSLLHDEVNHIFQAADSRIWISTTGGLSRWSWHSRTFRNWIPDPQNKVTSANYLLEITDTGDGDLWIGSAVGLYRFDVAAETFQLSAHDPADPFSPVKGPVLSICRDRSGIVWAGSWHAGLNMFDPTAQKFRFTRHDPEDPTSLDDDAVAAICEDHHGALWIGTGSISTGGSDGGLNRLDRTTGEFEHFTFPVTGNNYVRTVMSLCEDAEGVLWIGTNIGLWSFDETLGQPVRRFANTDVEHGVSDTPVRGIVVDAQNNLWLSTPGNGLYCIHLSTGEIEHYLHDPADPTTIAENRVILIHIDSRGRIWAGLDTAGINLFQPETQDFKRFFTPQVGLSSIIDIQEDTRGRLWIGTYTGLFEFDPELGIKRIVSRAEGLPHDAVASIVEDDRGGLWLSTSLGIAHYDPETALVRKFDTRDGLPGDELLFGHWRDRDGTIWMGGHGGLVRFHPDEILDNSYIPPVVLTEMRLGDTPVRVGANSPLSLGLPFTENVTLSHDQNDIIITFASLHYTHPERNSYRYQLDAYDDGWRDAGYRRSATYTNLEPGRYLFRVQGTNADGVWNEDGAVLRLTIMPPWWETNWAYGIYGLLILTFAVFIYRQIVQRERMRAAIRVGRAEALQLHELDQLKSRFFTNISHEFRTPLTLIQAPLQRLHDTTDEPNRALYGMMLKNARRLSQLIDQVLNLSRLEAGRLSLQWRRDEWLPHLQALVDSFRPLMKTRSVALVTEYPHDTGAVWFDPDLHEKILANLLSNAVRFTPDGGEITVTIEVSDHEETIGVPFATGDDRSGVPLRAVWLKIDVHNTGSFIPMADRERIFDRFHQAHGTAQGGTGIGLAFVKELTEWLHGNVEVTSNRDTGTSFTVTLPLFLEAPVSTLAQPEALQPETDTPAITEPSLETDFADDDTDDALPIILVVEDHADLRTFTAGILAPRFRVLEAADGAVGRDLAFKEIPDLVLSDVMMPVMDGFELCRTLKEDERTSHIPVVLLTALTEIESRREGLQTGADDYLAKPFDPEELLIRVENLIEQRRMLARKYARHVIDLAPAAMPVTSADERFIARAREAIDEHLEDEDFGIEFLGHEIGMSRSQLHRKIKALTGQTPSGFVRSHRLQRAAELLAGHYGNVTEVSYAVGFKSLSYFAKSFREQYGESPSEYAAKH